MICSAGLGICTTDNIDCRSVIKTYGIDSLLGQLANITERNLFTSALNLPVAEANGAGLVEEKETASAKAEAVRLRRSDLARAAILKILTAAEIAKRKTFQTEGSKVNKGRKVTGIAALSIERTIAKELICEAVCH